MLGGVIMTKKVTAGCVGVSIICAVVFFITYYCGIFYNLWLCFAVGLSINTLLFISKEFNRWGIKLGVYSIVVLLLVGIFQAYKLNEFLAAIVGYDVEGTTWGELLMISNGLWFGLVLGSALVSLGVTAVIVYFNERNTSEK